MCLEVVMTAVAVRSEQVPFLAVVGLASEEGEGSRCEEKRVHVSKFCRSEARCYL